MVPTIYWWQVYCTEIEFHLKRLIKKTRLVQEDKPIWVQLEQRKTQNKDTKFEQIKDKYKYKLTRLFV